MSTKSVKRVIQEPILKSATRTPGRYNCQKCDHKFRYKEGALSCPNCGNADQELLVAIFVEDDKTGNEIRSDDEYKAGD